MLSRWLFAQSQLFVFDEPTRGIDTAGKIQIYNILNELSREGKCALFITSDISEAIGMCDRILVSRSYTIVKEFLQLEASYDKIYKYLHSTLEK